MIGIDQGARLACRAVADEPLADSFVGLLSKANGGAPYAARPASLVRVGVDQPGHHHMAVFVPGWHLSPQREEHDSVAQFHHLPNSVVGRSSI
jgi:hypothetical protein